ncbi:hypothetical protein AB0K40_13140 [Nonomuraea bangladeshensis]|uniref:Uncharacterized protein n=1 Tax=Nonomuraea bangladeshensis TaxID=404385 RepID=A0ABV3H1M3_9ACTN
MPIKDFQFMESPTAADFNRYFMQQIFIRKTADESVTNSNVIQDDNHLFTDVVANTDYWVTSFIIYEGAANTDPNGGGELWMSWQAPSGSTFDWVSDSFGTNAASAVEIVSRTHQQLASTPAAGTVGLGTNLTAMCKGVLSVGPNPGVFRFRWAQFTPNASVSTRVKANSCLILRRLTT